MVAILIKNKLIYCYFTIDNQLNRSSCSYKHAGHFIHALVWFTKLLQCPRSQFDSRQGQMVDVNYRDIACGTFRRWTEIESQVYKPSSLSPSVCRVYGLLCVQMTQTHIHLPVLSDCRTAGQGRLEPALGQRWGYTNRYLVWDAYLFFYSAT